MGSTEIELTGPVHVASDAEVLYDDLGMALMGAAQKAVREREAFHLAVSGGSTPERFYMHLVMDVRYRAIPWEQTHLWVVDERRVPEDDEQSNWRMIREALTEQVPVPDRQKHPMPVMREDAAAAYEQELRRSFEEPVGVPRLDFVLLGMGDDCHTASLFPHSPALLEHEKLIAANEGEHVTPPPRLTMTYPLLNAAREVAVMVTGGKKAKALRRVESEILKGADPASLPITGVRPDRGSLLWYLDAEAAGEGE